MTAIETTERDRPHAGPRTDAGQAAPTGSSFYLGLRILPPEQRLAMYAIYAFCRAVDDVADDEGLSDRLGRLEQWSERIADLYAGRRTPDGLAALQQSIDRFGLRRTDFEAIVAGMAMDVRGETLAPSEAELDLYCDRVASAPGRLSVRVFGMEEEAGLGLAHHLGRALQLTNILRDVDEDAGIGRLYLPRERLAAAGLALLPVAEVIADARIDAVCRELAKQASAHFAEADRLMASAPRRQVRAPRIMAAAYSPLLEGLTTRGWAPPRAPVARSKLRIAAAVLRYGLV